MSVPKRLTDFNMIRISSRFSNFSKRMCAGKGFQAGCLAHRANSVERTQLLFPHDKLLRILTLSLCLLALQKQWITSFSWQCHLLPCAANASNCLKDATCLSKVQIIQLSRNEILVLQVLRRNRSSSSFLKFFSKTSPSYQVSLYLCQQCAL